MFLRKKRPKIQSFLCPNKKERSVVGGSALSLCRVLMKTKFVLCIVCGRKFTFSSVGGGGEEGGDACTAGTDTLGKSALGSQLDLELAREVLALKLLVLTDITADHALDLKQRGTGKTSNRVCMHMLVPA